ncbi:MAG: hypothetical protein QXH10_03795 [Ignisphaera sp.]|uniref:Uncharacterized protein n=1 Tax=Ignisphaera aggregans TaxID=334771 RepID=A0A7C4JK99_9CREN
MNRVLILVAANKDVVTRFAELIQKELVGVYVIPLYNNKLKYYTEKLTLIDADVAITNINCLNTSTLSEVRFLSSPQKFYILNFCFSCCKDNHKNKNEICLPPYLTLARLLVTRIKAIFEALVELKVRIELSSQELNQLTDTLGIKQNQINQCITACLSNEEENYYSLVLHAKNTSIIVTATGVNKSSKEKIQLNAQYIHYEQPKQISSFFAQIMSMLTLWLHREYLEKDVDVVTKIGYEEGLYTLYISKLIEYGADFAIKLS